jgi:hypothetical protein
MSNSASTSLADSESDSAYDVDFDATQRAKDIKPPPPKPTTNSRPPSLSQANKSSSIDRAATKSRPLDQQSANPLGERTNNQRSTSPNQPARLSPPPVQPTKTLQRTSSSGIASPTIAPPVHELQINANDDEVNFAELLNPKTWWARFVNDRQRLPSWLISLCVHLIVLILLGLIPIVIENKTVMNLFLNTSDGGDGDAAEFDLNAGTMLEDATVPSESIILSDISAEIAMPSVEPMLSPTSMESGSMAPAIAMGLTGRSGSLKDALLGLYGGNEQTQDAVELGLQWLARNQQPDGSWSMKGPFATGSGTHNKVAATSMALIAFAGAGNTPTDGEYAENVKKAVEQLISWQNESGRFQARDGSPEQHMAYAHAQATIALCELYGMTRDGELKGPAQLAVRFAEEWQDPDRGGWRYIPRNDSDLSVTGWYIMALTSARMAGLSTNLEVLRRADRYLDTVDSPDGSRYYYADYSVPSTKDLRKGEPPLDLAMTAEGSLCRMYLGWAGDDKRLISGANDLSLFPISIDVNERNYYYWYYCTQAMHHLGGDFWTGWNNVMREALPTLQVKEGREKGSFPPQGDPHGTEGGRLYSTCLAIYCLEVYYRHLPLYESKSMDVVK